MSEGLESAIARIYNQKGGIVGTGFLVSEQYLLTCAHVVADALGLDRYTVEKPQEPVSLDFPYLGVAGVTGQVMEWKPRAETETSEGDDIALIQLEYPVKGQQTRLVWTANISGDRYRASGFPRGYDSSVSSYGIVRDRLPNGRWQIEDDKETGIAIQGGFSGCPVWDERAKGIIGMVVEEADAKVAFMIPTEVLVKACPVLDEWVVPYPFMTEDLPEDFVPRPREFEPLIAYLLEGNSQPVAITAALKGAGGYGKTILARAICHDRRIRKAFRDGIFWVTLGETPDVAGGLTKLYQKLTDSTRTFVDREQAAGELAQQWENKHCLVVVDDVWNEAHLRPFLRGGERCTRLVTTRNSDTLPPRAQKVDVDAMQGTEAVELLGYDLPKEQQEEFRELAARLGEWALLLKLVNGVLRRRVQQRGQSLENALQYVQKGLDKKGVIAFDSRQPEARYQAVQATLAVSFSQLEEEERERYGELGIFPEDVDIPLTVVEKLWGETGGLDEFDTEELCDRLKQLSLLLAFNLEERTIRLHDVVRQYLQQETELVTVNNQLLDAYSQTLPPVSLDRQRSAPCPPVPNWWELPTDEPYVWQYLAYHLIEAGREEELRALLFNFNWLRGKLNATEINSLITDCDFLSDNTNLRLVKGALQLSSHVLVEDKTQLAGQLWGRLLSFEQPEIQALLNQTLHSISPLSSLSLPWLRTTTPSF